MSQQDDLKAIVDSENAEIAAIGAAIQTVTKEVADLEAANAAAAVPLDFSGLKAAVESLGAVPASVLAIVPPAPEPAA